MINLHLLRKLIFLSNVARAFDPLGFKCPFVVRAKMIVQKMCIENSDWDEEVSERVQTIARQWLKECNELNNLRIERCLLKGGEDNYCELHVFSDASEKAYGSVIYVRERTTEGIRVTLAMAKSKIAPIKIISVPRLELMAAWIGVKISITVATALKIEKRRIKYWTDSEDVLHWLNKHSGTLKPFVANRVSQIQQLSTLDQWRYVSTKENTADILSRGLDLQRSAEWERWFSGPRFLYDEEGSWPNWKRKTSVLEKEVKKGYAFCDSLR